MHRLSFVISLVSFFCINSRYSFASDLSQQNPNPAPSVVNWKVVHIESVQADLSTLSTLNLGAYNTLLSPPLPPLFWNVPINQRLLADVINWKDVTASDVPTVVWSQVLVSNNKHSIAPLSSSALIIKPPLPRVQALNRSVSFSDKSIGPDVSWKVPLGYRWSQDWPIDISIAGANTRPPNSNFMSWNNGDATGELHIRLFQSKNTTVGYNATFRSVYSGSSYDGGTTPLTDGFANGFRIDHSLSDTSGFAFGGEQIIQYDSNNDSGRNLYLVFSKAWWLSGRNLGYPLLTGTLGIGTGRLGDNPSLAFACSDIGNSSISLTQSYPLCWSPIGSAALVFNKNLSLFTEYNSQDWLAGLSLSTNQGFPLRFTWGTLFANKGTNYTYAGDNSLRWFFRASLGF